MSIPVSVKNLAVDWYLADNLYSTDDKRLLLKKSSKLTNTIIERLQKEFLVNDNSNYYVDVTLDPTDTMDDEKLKEEVEKLEITRELIYEQDNDIKSFVNDDLKNQVIVSLNESYYSLKQIEDNIDSIKKCISDITYQVLTNKNFCYSLGQYKEDTATKGDEHSFRVAQFAIVLADIYNKQVERGKKIDLDAIGLAAILHDYGTRFKDKKEMERLSSLEFTNSFVNKYGINSDILNQSYVEKYHSIYSYIDLSNKLSSSVCNMILLSNSTENSYLLSIHKDQTSPYIVASKIINLCNFYDSLLSIVIKDNISLENVSTSLFQLAENGLINKELTNLFFENIPLYSIGVRVLLSNGWYGTVVERYTGNDSFKPKVKIIGKDINNFDSTTFDDIPNEIDLRETTTITVKRIVASSEILSTKIKLNSVNAIVNDQLNTRHISSLENLHK